MLAVTIYKHGFGSRHSFMWARNSICNQYNNCCANSHSINYQRGVFLFFFRQIYVHLLLAHMLMEILLRVQSGFINGWMRRPVISVYKSHCWRIWIMLYLAWGILFTKKILIWFVDVQNLKNHHYYLRKMYIFYSVNYSGIACLLNCFVWIRNCCSLPCEVVL